MTVNLVSFWYPLEGQEESTMPASAKDCQISVRIARDTDAWLECRAGSGKNKAGFVRQLIEREMFNRAAADLNAADRAERESLLGGFEGGTAD
jgi:hypothetical protein